MPSREDALITWRACQDSPNGSLSQLRWAGDQLHEHLTRTMEEIAQLHAHLERLAPGDRFTLTGPPLFPRL